MGADRTARRRRIECFGRYGRPGAEAFWPVTIEGAAGAVISPVRKAITLLVQHPHLARVAGPSEGLRGIDVPGAALLAELIELTMPNPHMSTGALLEHYREDTGAGDTSRVSRRSRWISRRACPITRTRWNGSFVTACGELNNKAASAPKTPGSGSLPQRQEPAP